MENIEGNLSACELVDFKRITLMVVSLAQNLLLFNIKWIDIKQNSSSTLWNAP